MKTLFVSDLDGTLLQPDAMLSRNTINLLNESVAEGKLFSIATARTPATVVPILKEVDLRLPAIVITGAAMFDLKTGHYSHIQRMREEVSRKLVDIYRDSHTSSYMFTLGDDDLINIYHLCGRLTPIQQLFYEQRINSPYKKFHLSDDGSDTLPPTFDNTILFYTMLPDAKARSAYEMVKHLEGVKAQYYHDIYGEETGILEAFAAGATKANAVRRLAEQTGADRIVCFGDNVNDLPMMEVADVAVAVENALPEVKEAADIIIGPNTSDSVARFIADF